MDFIRLRVSIQWNKDRKKREGGRNKKEDRLTESKFPEVAGADPLAYSKVGTDHHRVRGRRDTMLGEMHVGSRGVTAATGGPLSGFRIAFGATHELLLANLSTVSFLHFSPSALCPWLDTVPVPLRLGRFFFFIKVKTLGSERSGSIPPHPWLGDTSNNTTDRILILATIYAVVLRIDPHS